MDAPVWIFSALDCYAEKESDSTARALHAWNDLKSTVCGLACIGANPCQTLFEWTKTTACSYHMRPISIITGVYVLIIALCALMWSVLGRMLRYYAAKRGSGFVPCSLAAIKEWRSAHAALFPQTPHCWTKAKDISAPVVCCVCTNPVTGSQWQSCEYCGVVVHNTCGRYASHDCRPLAVRSDSPPAHDWKPAGVTLPLMQMEDVQGGVRSPSTSSHLSELPWSSLKASDGAVRELLLKELCLFCQQPCEIGLFAVEPVWRCTCCHALGHMRCCVQRHATLFSTSIKTALAQQLASLEGEITAQREGSGFFSNPASGLGSPRDSYREERGLPVPFLGLERTAGGADSTRSDSKDAKSGAAALVGKLSQVAAARIQEHVTNGGMLKDQACGSGSSRLKGSNNGGGSRSAGQDTQGHICSISDNMSGGGEQAITSPGPLSQSSLLTKPPPLHLPRKPLDRLLGYDPDVCTLGLASHVVLPCTAIWDCSIQTQTIASPSSFNSSITSESGTLSVGVGSSGVVVRGGSVSKSASHKQKVSSPFLASASASKQLIARGKKWLLERRSKPKDRWSGYRVDCDVLKTFGCRPLLVFVNLKSGPQVGESIKRQLLQLLHPLQVVELPREAPEPSLRFFLKVPGARILVVGGDGTVSWVLSCLDKLRIEQESSANSSGQHFCQWKAPPVAVFPMGTGNDLARCLHWGGTVAKLMRKPFSELLEEVAVAVPTSLDRWDVQINPHAPNGTTGNSLKRLFQRKASSGKSGKTVAASQDALLARGTEEDSSKQEIKTLNNYIGIGIDAKVAYQFHQIRDNYPSFFHSQFGNKMWYTGVGSLDLVHRSCASLYKRLRLECDGVEVPLPHDAEGLVVLNIGCHMGGVFLWEEGLPAPRIPSPGGVKLTRERHPSLNDELLEVVAIGGVLHMGRLAVGLSRAQRLCQCQAVRITTHEQLPMQVDGEPWYQGPATLSISLKSGQKGLVLKRLQANSPVSKMQAIVNDTLERSFVQGTITEAQRASLALEMTSKLEAWF